MKYHPNFSEQYLRLMDTSERFGGYLAKGDNFCRQDVSSLVFVNHSKIGATLKGKNLLPLLWKQSLSFKSSPILELRQIFSS